jgi:hypothetical protein
MVLTKRFKLGEEEDGYGSSPTANRVVMVQRSEEGLFPATNPKNSDPGI